MSVISPQGTLQVSTPNHEPLSLTIEGDAPLAVRVEVENTCTCGAGHARHVGSYTDTLRRTLGARKPQAVTTGVF